jgi:ATP-dependent helicase/nuclease subunit B
MGVQPNAGPAPHSHGESWLDEALAHGNIVIASSERAARALTAVYHRGKRVQGLTAWPAPNIQPWDDFVRQAWQRRASDGRLVLSPLQEQSLWVEIVAADKISTWLPGPLHRIARLAMDAQRLLCFYAPRYLHSGARAAWQQDAAAFSRWLTTFDDACRTGGFISAARLPLELVSALGKDSAPRPPLFLAGFDRMLPIQHDFFTTWGEWREAPRAQPADSVAIHRAPDASAELAACALWCAERLSASLHARLLVITQEAAARRGEIERTFSRYLPKSENSTSASPLFEFSLGVPLGQVALGRGALRLLKWLDAPIEEPELDWLISTGQLAADEEESGALAAFMRSVRRRGLERTQWALRDFIRQSVQQPLPARWAARISQAQQRLEQFNRANGASNQKEARTSPLAWAELTPRLLESAGWPGGRVLASAEFQILRRWEMALDACASLGFAGRQISWSVFLTELERTLNETLFAPESQDAPILIAGPAESAGLEADGIWFLGARENAWPAAGALHPLLPLDVQRDAEMPHASAQLDWRLAETITHRLLASAPEIRFSYARTAEDADARPSRLILKAAGAPQELPATLLAPRVPDACTLWIEDRSQIPFPGGSLRGGANGLTEQSQCPFKAFAIARLGAESWDAAQAGLTPRQRGALLHHVLHSIWSGPPTGIRSHAELLAKLDSLEEFVRRHVRDVLANKLFGAARSSMPPAYLALEETRLITLLADWLRFEAARVPFSVAETEFETDANIAGLDLRLRLDRIDRLIDGSPLVIDYKTGDVTPKSWDLPRPDDVQMPLYAGFALRPSSGLPGMVFAKVRAGQNSFAGRIADAAATLRADLSPQSDLVRRPLTQIDLDRWREAVEDLARDFLQGRAEADPREFPKTCERCGLQTLCRVHESRTEDEPEDGDNGEAQEAEYG